LGFSGIFFAVILEVVKFLNMNTTENKKIQKEIINLFERENECELGYLISELDYTYNQILENVLELKNQGKIFKLHGHKGYFSLKSN